MGIGRGPIVGGSRSGDGLAARVVYDATAIGQRLESFSQFAESAASPSIEWRAHHGQETAPHVASRRPVGRPVRL